MSLFCVLCGARHPFNVPCDPARLEFIKTGKRKINRENPHAALIERLKKRAAQAQEINETQWAKDMLDAAAAIEESFDLGFKAAGGLVIEDEAP